MANSNIMRPIDDLPESDVDTSVSAADLDAVDNEATEPPGELDADDIELLEDGSAVVRVKPEKEKQDSRFDDNLADNGVIPDEELARLGTTFCDLVDADAKAREERDKQYAEGIRRAGLTKNDKAGADFDGASSVTHPMLARGCVDFASRAVKELLPSAGPVRTHIVGRQNDAKLDRAERKKEYMNWQLTVQIPEHRPEFEKMLSQLPLGGSQYKRWWYDSKMERARTTAVYIDDIFLPFDQNDFYTTPRLTHREFVGLAEFEARIDSGLYRETFVSKQGDNPDRSEAALAARDVEGVNDEAAIYTHTGGTRQVYTIYADLQLDDDPLTKGELAPYILHVEEYGSKVLGLYRNWKEGDKKRQKLHWIVEYNFIPWRGAYAIGLAQLIGSLSISATGALNALLDSAHISSFPGGLKLKGGRNSGQTIQVNPTELQELDAPPGVDDIRKLVMAFPFQGPSTVLYQLLEWLTAQAEMVVSTASEKIADAGANMPMGTALALIEGGSTNFSAIHARLHNSMQRELEILHRLNATYINDQETVEELGELVVYREDFVGPLDVMPVSDPNIFSEAQRYAQLQAVLQLAGMPQFAQFFKPERLLVRALRLLQVSYAEDIANLPKDPARTGPVEENSAAALDDGTPLKVYEEQDDFAHLQSHVMFMTSPLLGANPIIGSVAVPKLLAHCKEHMIAYYRKHHDAASQALMHIAKMRNQELTEESAQSMGHAFADQAMAHQLAPVVAPGLAQAAKLAQQYAPKPPADGNTQATLAAQQAIKGMELQAQAADKDKQRTFELQKNQQTLQFNAQENERNRQQQDQAAAIAAAVEQAQNRSEQQIATMTLMMQDQQKAQDRQLQVLMAQMKEQSDATMVVLQALMAQWTAANAPQKPAAQGEGEATGAAPEQPSPPSATPAPDLTPVVQPLLNSLQNDVSDVQSALHGGGENPAA